MRNHGCGSSFFSGSTFCFPVVDWYRVKRMRKRVKEKRKGVFPAGWIFFSGFLLGVGILNGIWKLEWQQKTISAMYLLSTFAEKEVWGMEYFLEVLRLRGSWFLLFVLCGFSIFGVPLAIVGMLLSGAEIGAMLTMSILQFGLAGGAVGAGLLMPHTLLYLPVMLFLAKLVYGQSVEIWRNHGIFPRDAGNYLFLAMISGLVYFGGILLEAYGNPWTVKLLTKILNMN